MFKKGSFRGFLSITLMLLLASLVLSGCNKSPALAKLAAKMYDHYHEHFLNVRLQQDKSLVVYFQIDIKKHSEMELHDKAFDIARYAYQNYNGPAEIQTVEIYMQTIGAPTRINESDAKDYRFDITTLGGDSLGP